MKLSDLNRRVFNRWTFATLGGLVTGAALADEEDEEAVEKKAEGEDSERLTKPDEREKHVCRGLNSCKGHGRDGRNRCAGMGLCATVPHIECAGENECKAMGGCGLRPGQNECKGRGFGGVPLEERAWNRARKHFEERMKQAGKEFGKSFPPFSEGETQADIQGSLKQIEKAQEQLMEQRRKEKEEEERKRKEKEAEKKEKEKEEIADENGTP